MQWFYAQNGRQIGPVSEEEIQRLADAGSLAPSTLVWHEGLANWQPWSTLQPAGPGPGSDGPPPIGQLICVECQRAFPESDLLRYDKLHVCAGCKPVFFQKLQEGLVPGTNTLLWRSGKVLVLRREAEFPDRCVKCNAPAGGHRLGRKLHWHAPGFYFLILLNLLIYLIVAVFVSKRAKIQVGLCADHRRQRLICLFIAWLLSLGSLAALAYGIAEGKVGFGLAGLGLLLVGAGFGLITGRTVWPKRIEEQFIWLKGVSPKFLENLAEFPGKF